MAKGKRQSKVTCTFRTPFCAMGRSVLDGLGYVVAEFKDCEYIEGENPAEVIADALNKKYGVRKGK